MRDMNIAIYPGSFDPITKGHLDIIDRGSKIYDKLIVAVLVNMDKKCLFDIEERVELIKKVTKDLDNVEVLSFEGLLVDFARIHNSKVILKGLRTVSDFEYEFQMALMNSKLDPDIETVFMMTSSAYSYVSSSSVKQVAKFGGNIKGLVPEELLQKLWIDFKDFYRGGRGMDKIEVNIIELLEYLEELIETAPKVPITGKSVIDKKEFLEVIDQVINYLPDQLKKAQWVMTEKDRILGDAQKQYESTKSEIMEMMKQKVENHDIVKESKIRANEIIALAQRDAKAIRIGSREYSTEILAQLDREIEEKRNMLIENMQKSFEMAAKDIDEKLSSTGDKIKENISELRGM